MTGDAVAKECVSSRVLVWCLLAPSRGGVLLLGETWSAELNLGDPCLIYGPFPANAHPPCAWPKQRRGETRPAGVARLVGCARAAYLNHRLFGRRRRRVSSTVGAFHRLQASGVKPARMKSKKTTSKESRVYSAVKIPVWWRRAVLPSLPWVVCFLSFFLESQQL